MSSLKNKNIIVGISGSIAAYKSCEIIRFLVKSEAAVLPVMTKNAAEFVTSLTIRTLSKNRVYDDMFSTLFDWDIEHVSIAKKADLFLIAPATANVIAKITAGIADDALTTLILSVKCPVVICPAMNSEMYKNQITQENISKLKKIGFYFIGPEKGELACGDEDIGRMSEPRQIISEIEKILKNR
ncbi:MAG: flavoprotein [Elusimicrobia bacterium]|nr:flavoprotein [Elusimicrobiota bacterium]